MGFQLFPVRVPIGYVSTTDRDGNEVDLSVLMTPEFARALADLLTRIGGENGMDVDEIANYLADLSAQSVFTPPDLVMANTDVQQVIQQVTIMRQELQDLQQQLDSKSQILNSLMSDLENIIVNPVSQNQDWEHPGKIGNQVPNTGKFTSIDTPQVNNSAGDLILYRSSAERIRATATGGTVTGALTVTGAAGFNGKAPQTPLASGGNMTATAATNVAPYGFTTAAQADQIADRINKIQAALIAIGIQS